MASLLRRRPAVLLRTMLRRSLASNPDASDPGSGFGGAAGDDDDNNISTGAPTDHKSEPTDDFRKLELYPKSTPSRAFKREPIQFEVPQPRADRMPIDQDWPSVWPAAATFKPSVVPLPVRQGYYNEQIAPVGKYGNLELMKIPNFLHLTPKAIERHCQAIKKFCSKWPEAATDERTANWLTITTSDYVHSGPTIRDERARIVTVRLKLSSLDLDKHARDKFLKLVGPRYDSKRDEVVIVTDRCPMRHQNLDYSLYVLTALFHESWITEPWELTEITEADTVDFDFEGSRSERYATEYVGRSKQPEAPVSEYAETLSRLKNQGDNNYNLDAYKNAVCKLMNLKPPETAVVS